MASTRRRWTRTGTAATSVAGSATSLWPGNATCSGTSILTASSATRAFSPMAARSATKSSVSTRRYVYVQFHSSHIQRSRLVSTSMVVGTRSIFPLGIETPCSIETHLPWNCDDPCGFGRNPTRRKTNPVFPLNLESCGTRHSFVHRSILSAREKKKKT